MAKIFREEQASRVSPSPTRLSLFPLIISLRVIFFREKGEVEVIS